MKKTIITVVMVAVAITLSAAGERKVLCEIELKNNKGETRKTVEIVKNDTSPSTYSLAVIKSPGITEKYYALTGKVKYEDVAGNGYLETLNYLDGNTSYFSRTLNQNGVAGKLTDSSGWRNFAVPFSLDGAHLSPEKIEFNLHLPGKGKVQIKEVKLIQADSMSKLMTSSEVWWSNRQAGLIGGIAGSILGLIGALTGTLCAIGKGKKITIAIMSLTTAFGILLIPAGIFAIVSSQPYHVYYPLLLSGIIAASVFGINIITVKKRFRQMELKKMESMDR